jgi:hypothetical protein
MSVDIPLRPTITQAAKRLNCSDKTVRRMIADGRLKAYRRDCPRFS